MGWKSVRENSKYFSGQIKQIMKQIIQDLKSGDTILENVPVPQVKSEHILIKTHRTLVSLGTEKMLVNFGKANFIDKARQQPDKVKQVLQKIQSDGLKPTMETVFRKLGEPLPLGYCNAGEVIGVGKGVTEFKIGDRVVSNGNHAEVVNVPKNLVAKIPDGVSYEEAAFTVIGAIGLQGIRLINPTFGETIVVTGLGLIGLMASQILMANGCKVIGVDFDQSKVDLAKSWGVQAYNAAGGTDVVKLVEDLTDGVGADAVLITASTKSDEVISQAANMSRKRGRIVLVGVIGLNIMRSDFYEKELSFQVSCSYGPGRYDDEYETKGNDYPLPYVRWTEKRNFEAILAAISNGQINVKSLITETVDLENYNDIYGNMSNSKSIASILKYKGDVSIKETSVEIIKKDFKAAKGVLGIIGAGNFTKAMIVPMLSKLNANIKYIASSKGLSGTTTAKKYGIVQSTTNYKDILGDNEVDAVLITTQHNAHASQVIECLKAGKHVFVEKPLALTNDEIDKIVEVYQQGKNSISVGFNRRFSPFMIDAKRQLGNTQDSPIHVVATMNAGFIPADSWVQDMEVGGGRIIGEACHLIDLITYLTDSLVESVVMNAMGTNPDSGTDNASILLKYKNGSNGVINYFSNGDKAYSKERVEVYSQGRTIVMDNFRKSKYYGFKSSGMSKTQDKGHYNQFKLLVENLKKDGSPTIPFEQVINTSRAAIAAVESLQKGNWIHVK
jgi:predicted dehydrogenase/threonine dehydrogenase-like Zn-dependent dehydrogenase